MIKVEIDTINGVVDRMDRITQRIKNWAIVVWAGTIAVSLREDLSQYIEYSAILPILFWYVDARVRQHQRAFIFRSQKIGDFLNSTNLANSFEQNSLIDFKVFDPAGKQYFGTSEQREFTSIFKTLRMKDIAVLYLGMSSISIIAGLFLI